MLTSRRILLTPDQKRRYARHILLPQIGEEGQQKLLNSSVLVIGAGGLGAAAISYLAAAGIGRIGIIDHDKVELSNLNRQIIHESGDIGRFKVESAADRVSEINPECTVEVFAERFGESPSPAGGGLGRGHESRDISNKAPLLSSPLRGEGLPHSFDLILDGSDNFPTRFAINDACIKEKKTLVSAAVRGFEGQISTFKAYLGAPHPCYRCLVPDAPPGRNDCVEQGVLGPLVGILGSMQAMEAIKELLGIGDSLSGRLLRYDGLRGVWKESALHRDPACEACHRKGKKNATNH